MAIRKILAALLSVSLLAQTGCISPEPVRNPPLETEGEVVVYLEPLPQTARDLRFIFSSISALLPDGSAVPLNLRLREVNGKDHLDRQKRLAVGRLTPGTYSGLSLTLSSAHLLGEEGEAELLLSGSPIRVARPFEVVRRQATALFLRFDASGLMPGSVFFDPEFSLHMAQRPLFNLYGFVSNTAVNRVTVFNKSTMRVTDVIATGGRPSGLAVAPRRRRVYVACTADHRIEEIDILKGEVVDRIDLQFGDGPRELAVTPDERTMVAANFESDTVSIVDLGSLVEISRVNVGRRPLGVAIDDTGTLAFVVNSLSNSVSVVDIREGTLVAQLPVETTPLRAVVEPRSGRLFVIHRQSPNLLVFDSRNLSLLGKIFAGAGSTAIARDPNSQLVYVGNVSGEILVVSPQALMFVDAIQTGSVPLANLIFEEEETCLYALRSVDRTLLKIDITGKRILSKLEVEEEAYSVAVIGER